MKYTITIINLCRKFRNRRTDSAEEAYDSAIKGYKSGKLVLNPSEVSLDK